MVDDELEIVHGGEVGRAIPQKIYQPWRDEVPKKWREGSRERPGKNA